MPTRQLFTLLFLLTLTSFADVATINQKEIIFSAVECEINSLDERNAHYIPWRKLKDNYHVFVAVGASDSCDPNSDVMQALEKLPAVRRRSEGHIDNSRDVVRDLKSGFPGEIVWIKQVSVVDQVEAIVSAEIITADWCKTGVNFFCRYEQGKWHVTSRENEWQKCTSPLPPAK